MSTTPTNPVNILMVDDQPSKLLSYEVMLGELGENLVKATSGREALELLLKTDVAVVLMDVSMPEIDGFELAEMICDVVGFDGDLTFDPTQPDGTPRKLLDVSKVNALGWRAKISLRDGITHTYEWFLANEKTPALSAR
jgi:nucleoside-diphosphate-sugar epimerase